MRVFLVWALVGLAARAAPATGMVSDTLYFGARKPDGVVAPAEWDRFLAEVVTPRFPTAVREIIGAYKRAFERRRCSGVTSPAAVTFE